MTTESPPPRYSRFDGFELDRRTGRLTRGGTAVALPEQALQVLGALLEHPGEPVSRDRLQDVLWPGDTAGDFDNKLNGVIRKLRNALDDDAESPRFIETLPRRGYRFIEPIESSRGATPGKTRRPPRVVRVAMMGGAALAVMLLVTGIVAAPGRGVRPLPRLAVLPLEDRSADEAGQVVARYVTEELTHQLARLDPNALVVLARKVVSNAGGQRSFTAAPLLINDGDPTRDGPSPPWPSERTPSPPLGWYFTAGELSIHYGCLAYHRRRPDQIRHATPSWRSAPGLGGTRG